MFALVLWFATGATTAACPPRGPVVFRVTRLPILHSRAEIGPARRGRFPARFELALHANGAWRRLRDGAPDGAGCVPPAVLRLLRKQLAAARFRYVRAASCRALANTEVLLEDPVRGLRYQGGEPCA